MLVEIMLQPYDISGNGTPTTGKIPIVMPTLIMTCASSTVVTPNEENLQNRFLLFIDIEYP